MQNLFLSIIVFLAFTSCKTKIENAHQNSNFDLFLTHFKSINLPYIIENENQFPNYMKYDETTTVNYRDTIYKFVDSLELQFLYDDKIGTSNIKYRYGNLFLKNKESLALFYIRDSIDIEGNFDNSWIFLNTYKLNGELIDKLTLAGYYFDIANQFCTIDKNLNITTKHFTFLADSLNANAIRARLIQVNSSISNSGKIVKNLETDTIKYFSIDSDGKYVDYKTN